MIVVSPLAEVIEEARCQRRHLVVNYTRRCPLVIIGVVQASYLERTSLSNDTSLHDKLDYINYLRACFEQVLCLAASVSLCVCLSVPSVRQNKTTIEYRDNLGVEL